MDSIKSWNFFQNIFSRLMVFYGYYLSYHPGKWRIIQRLTKLGKLHQFKNSNCVVKRNGIYYQLDTTEAIDRTLYYIGVYEGLITRFIQCVAQSGLIFFDIGANIGYYTLLVSRISRGSAEVYAFEPCPDEFKKLQRNLSLNDFRRVRLYQIALSDITGKIGLTEKKKGGLTRLSSSPDEIFQEVLSSTLDNFIQENKLSRVDILKVDIEGAEVKFLRGALQTISNYSPLIIIELNPKALSVFGNNVYEIEEILSKFNYILYECKRAGLMVLNQMPKFDQYINAIALPANKLKYSKRIFSWADLKSGLVSF